MRKSAIALTLLLAVGGSGLTFAQQTPVSFEVSIFGGREYFDITGIDDDFLYGLRLGLTLTRRLEIEGYFDTVRTKDDAGLVDLDVDNYGLNLLWTDFETEDAHVPYILIGVGHGEVDGTGVMRDYDYWEFGIGYRYFYDRYFGLRIDARTLGTNNDGNLGTDNFDVKATLGLSFVFGGSS